MTRIPARWRPIFSCLAMLALLGTAPSCKSLGYSLQSPIIKTKDPRIGPGKLTPDAIQSEVMSFADTFSGIVAQRWNEAATPDDLPDATPDDLYRARHAAHEHKLASVSAALTIAASPNSLVNVADMITLVTLERQLLEQPATAATFGAEAAANLVDTYRENEDAIWRIGLRVFTPKQQKELRDMIEEWTKVHPDQRYVSQVRLEDFAVARQQGMPAVADSKSLLSLVMLDPLAGLDPAKREVRESRMLGARAFFYMTHMPTILKWQAESYTEGLLHAPEIQKFSQAAERVSTTAEKLREDFGAERKAAMDQFFAGLGEQREALLADLDRDQEKFQGTLQEFRGTVVSTNELAGSVTVAAKAVESLADRVMQPPGEADPDRDKLAEFQAMAVDTGAAAERLSVLATQIDKLLDPAAINERTAALQSAVDEARSNAEGVIDYAFRRLLLLVLLVPVVVVLAVAAYRWLTRRSRTWSPESARHA